HDLRQPVSAIMAYASVFKVVAERNDALGSVADGADNILTSARLLDRMIQDLLDASRLGAGQLRLDPMRTDIGIVVQGAVRRAGEATAGRDVEIRIEDGIPPALADPSRVEQVLGNLLSNAAKYGYPGTPIAVEVRACHRELEISVTNHGDGVRKEDIPRLFNRFFRSADARTAGTAGLGLGLHISRELVRAHGGRIWVESSPGGVTAFRFTLPIASEQQQEP
ncbi:MAG: hypothetical protein GEU73_16735, partial [Chloroflexi bacterium]|nr:hypothetical protein [Chloroflexota bacterium]